MNQINPIEPKQDEEPTKINWGRCVGIVALSIPFGIFVGYLANELLLSLPHLNPWVSYPLYAVGWLVMGLFCTTYVLFELLNVLGGIATLYLWGREQCMRLIHQFSPN
ncbi:hypothetical protein EON83_05745 [bacterium]|nr:MAG: hypothetical protein EON83_05745 [bacterium]